ILVLAGGVVPALSVDEDDSPRAIVDFHWPFVMPHDVGRGHWRGHDALGRRLVAPENERHREQKLDAVPGHGPSSLVGRASRTPTHTRRKSAGWGRFAGRRLRHSLGNQRTGVSD